MELFNTVRIDVNFDKRYENLVKMEEFVITSEQELKNYYDEFYKQVKSFESIRERLKMVVPTMTTEDRNQKEKDFLMLEDALKQKIMLLKKYQAIHLENKNKLATLRTKFFEDLDFRPATNRYLE